MRSTTLKFRLRSAATFGRGEGLPGLVDQETEHDADGFPYLRGRALRGLLAEEMESILHSLGDSGKAQWQKARDRLLGLPGELGTETGIMRVGNACLPAAVRHAIVGDNSRGSSRNPISPESVLEALTGLRRQTAMTVAGAPDKATLRTMRVVVRDTLFHAPISFDEEIKEDDPELPLLAATVLAWRRAGTGRNRGRGRLTAWLEDEAFTHRYFDEFKARVLSP